MATYVSELEVAKKNLSEALGENVKQYWANLKLWFKQKISKEEFDLEARRLLTQDNVHSHNDFLLAILTRCQILVSAPGLATHFDLRATKSDTQGWVDHVPFASKERRRSEKKKCVRKKEMGIKRQLKTEESDQRDSPNHLSFSLLAKKIKY